MNFNVLRLLEYMAVAFGIIGSVIAGYLVLDNMHAKRDTLLKTEIDLRSDIINRDIKKDAEARSYYKNIEMERDLSKAEARRLEYLEEQMERKYVEQESIQARKDAL